MTDRHDTAPPALLELHDTMTTPMKRFLLLHEVDSGASETLLDLLTR